MATSLTRLCKCANSLAQQRQSGDTHFEGITYINLADAQRATGDIAGSMESASKAIELLQASSAGSEVSAAQAMVGWALAHQGELGLARQEIRTALSGMNDAVRFDVLYEATDTEATYGDITRASDYLAELGSQSDWTSPLLGPLASLVALRTGAFRRRNSTSTRGANRSADQPDGAQVSVLTLRAHAMLSARDALLVRRIERRVQPRDDAVGRLVGRALRCDTCGHGRVRGLLRVCPK